MGRRTVGAKADFEDGFTLVELAMALAVIGVLLGIALPTYLGTRAGAQDQAAKTVAMAGVKAHRAVSGDESFDVDAARRVEPNVDFEALPPAAERVPSVLGRVYLRVDVDQVTFVSRSRTGRCFWAQDQDAGVRFAQNDCNGWPEFTTSW